MSALPVHGLPPGHQRGFLVRHERSIALAVAGTYFVLFATLAVLRHLTAHSTAYDLAVFDQAYWNTTQGRFFESTLDRGSCEPTSLFGGHFSPVHLALLPLYALVPRAETLLVVQTAALTAGVWPLYLMARDRLQPGLERIVPVAGYFLIAPLGWMSLFDFHEIPLAVVPLGFAVLFLSRGQHGRAVLVLLASFLIKEELPLVSLGFGAYLLAKRDWLRGGAVIATSVGWFVLTVSVLIPAVAGGDYKYTSFYASLGDDEIGIVRTVLTDPGRTLGVLSHDGRMKLRFVAALLGPGLGLALLSGPGVLLLLPTLAYSLLSDYSHQYSLQSHYPAVLIPLAVGTSILGLARLRGTLRRVAPLAALASSLLFAYLYGDLPLAAKFDPGRFTREARYDAVAGPVAAIPAGARVSASDFAAAQLAHRRYLSYYGVQNTCGTADYVILDRADPQFIRGDATRFAVERDALRSVGYEEVAVGEGIVILRKR
ncbi:DUF2079 domain-containing protein [soil metagenome]